MLDIQFSSPEVRAYSAGRAESQSQEVNYLSTITMNQTHSSNVVIVHTPQNQVIDDCDAVITPAAGLLLKVRHADCLPVLIYHPSGIVAAVHAGRKGTQLDIVTKVLEKMREHFSIHNQVELWFGPAICENCYQIDRVTDLHFDLIEENTKQVRSVFTETEAIIQYSAHCTAHENENFYSYRAEGKGVPMNWSGIARL